MSDSTGTCRLLFANVTSWSESVVADIRAERSDFIGISETHVPNKYSNGLVNDLKRIGFGAARVVDAVATGEGGTSGGLVLAARTPNYLGCPSCSKRADRWTCGTIRLKKVTVLVFTPYLHVNQGLSPDNLAILGEIERAGLEMAMPIIVAGDFNLTEDEILKSGIMRTLGLLSARRDRLPTVASKDGRSIDHVLVSHGLR